MAQRRFDLWLGSRALICVRVANELWFNTAKNGERHTLLFNIGIYTRPDTHPSVRLFSLTVLWLVIQLGFAIQQPTTTGDRK